jgi:hypothetical protein
MKKTQKSSQSRRVAFALGGLLLTSTLFRANAATLQTFDRLFQGDDPTEGFDFNLLPDPSAPSVIRFSGFAENRDTFSETGVRFWLGSGRTNGTRDELQLFPPEPEFFMGYRLPPAHPMNGPLRVPIQFQARLEYSPAWVHFTVEGLGCCDDFRFVGDLTIEPAWETQLRISRLGNGSIQIAWPTNAADYHLECAATLSVTNWITVTNPIDVAGGRFSIAVGGAAAQRFYRLRR